MSALVTALRNDGLEVGAQIRALVRDENGRQAGVAIVDLTVNDRVAVEVKAIDEINESHKAQLRAWLRPSGVLAVALVINLGLTFEIARVFQPLNCDARQ